MFLSLVCIWIILVIFTIIPYFSLILLIHLPPRLNNVLIHQQHVSSEYKVRGGNGNVLITLETGVERDIRNHNKTTCTLLKSDHLIKKIKVKKLKVVNNINIYFVICLLRGPSDNIVIVWTLVIPVHHCQLYQDILVLTTYLINIRVTLPQHKLTSSDLVTGCQTKNVDGHPLL